MALPMLHPTNRLCGQCNKIVTLIRITTSQVDHNDKDNKSLNAFNELWESKFAKDSLLVFSTGRSHALYSDLRVRHQIFHCLHI